MNTSTHQLFTHLTVTTLVKMVLDLDEGLQIQRAREDIDPSFHEAREFMDQILDYLYPRGVTFERDFTRIHGGLIVNYNYPPTEA